MKNLVYSGSFDPLTFGHLDIIKRAAKIGQLHILVAINTDKTSLIPIDKRVQLIQEALESLNIHAFVESSEDATVDYLKSLENSVLVRGVRDSLDWEQEARLDLMNKGIFEESETIFLQASPRFKHVSSSYARELLRIHKSLVDVCPESFVKHLQGNVE